MHTQPHRRTAADISLLLFVLLAALLFAGCTVSVHAQALPAATGPGSFLEVGGGVSLFRSDYGQATLGGYHVTLGVNPTWRVGVEAEMRSLRFHTTQDPAAITETNYLVGPRIRFPHQRLVPYAKFLIGSGKIDLPYHYAQGSFLTYAPGAGFEYNLSDRFTVRVVDLEYQMWRSFPYGSLHPYGLSTGIIFHINPLSPLPDSHSRAKAH